MSGVEVLGIMASVAQITQCAISITSAIAEIYGTVQAAPARVQQGSEQLERLLVTADMIKENRMTQTKSVEAHLAAIVADVNALRVLLSRLATSSKKSFKRYLRVCLGNLEEREMIAQFDKIEKEKTALVLSIIAVHSSFSDATLDTVRPMANKVDNMHQDMRSLTETLQHMALESRGFPRVISAQRKLAESSGGCAARGRRPVSKMLLRSSDSSNSPPPESAQRFPMPPIGNQYKNIETRDQAKQLNGDIGDALLAKSNRYEGLMATGCSLQLNGNMSSAAFIASAFGK
ncbi:hypothetical protein LPUS_03483 [Lasallia pustulata]|uniref:Fungal N-terminal domain-containing protein n=1 Tax=Lasallia pustulata TaxID=136370 RepID=A0A1W5CUU8_9LECA|nr:hypothetical protein LPUS_03483 [Lasallia pustulata]